MMFSMRPPAAPKSINVSNWWVGGWRAEGVDGVRIDGKTSPENDNARRLEGTMYPVLRSLWLDDFTLPDCS